MISPILGRYDARKRRTLKEILLKLQDNFDELRFCELQEKTGLSSQALSDGLKELQSLFWIEKVEHRRYRITPRGKEALRTYHSVDKDFSAGSEELMNSPIGIRLISNYVLTNRSNYGIMSAAIFINAEMPTDQEIEKLEKWYNEEYLPNRCRLLDMCPVPISGMAEASILRRLDKGLHKGVVALPKKTS